MVTITDLCSFTLDYLDGQETQCMRHHLKDSGESRDTIEANDVKGNASRPLFFEGGSSSSLYSELKATPVLQEESFICKRVSTIVVFLPSLRFLISFSTSLCWSCSSWDNSLLQTLLYCEEGSSRLSVKSWKLPKTMWSNQWVQKDLFSLLVFCAKKTFCEIPSSWVRHN